MDIAQFLLNNWWVIVLLIILLGSFFTVNQGYVGVVTMFGKYQRAARPGLNMKISNSRTGDEKNIRSKPFSGNGVPGSNRRSGQRLFQMHACLLNQPDKNAGAQYF